MILFSRTLPLTRTGSEVSGYQLLLGGAVHEMAGTSGPSVVLEIGLLPPMGLPPNRQQAAAALPYLPSSAPTLTAAFKAASAEEEEELVVKEVELEGEGENSNQIQIGGAATQATANMLVSNVGGLGPQLEQIVRRVLVSRADPKVDFL